MLQEVWVSSASSKPKFNVGVPTVERVQLKCVCRIKFCSPPTDYSVNMGLWTTNYIYIYIYIWYIGIVRPSIGNIMYSPLVVLSKWWQVVDWARVSLNLRNLYPCSVCLYLFVSCCFFNSTAKKKAIYFGIPCIYFIFIV